MGSTFHGLETAKRGMYAQQSALYVTGHNIANANTPGFSRQRVSFVTSEPYPAAAMNRPQIPGQMGTGVYAGTIERVRESFLDIQYRNENNKLGYWESRAASLSKMEDIMNEPTENGLAAVMGEFWQSLQDLSVYPENEGTRQVVLQRGQAVVDTFHYLNESLTSIKNDFRNEIGINLQDINSILSQIGDLNRQIGEVEPHGYLPNDLYDQRDLLVDKLSQYVSIKVNKTSSGGDPQAIAEGQYQIQLVDNNGNALLGADGKPIQLVSGTDYVQLGFQGDTEISFAVPAAIKDLAVYDSKGKTMTTTIPISDSNGEITFSLGKLRGLIESFGYEAPSTDASGNPTTIEKGIYPDMLAKLDKLAYSFANIFNHTHTAGYTLEGVNGKDFFKMAAGSAVDFSNKEAYKGAAKDILLTDLRPDGIAASANGTGTNAGDGQNALNLADIPSMLLTSANQYSAIETGTLNSFYEAMIGKLGVEALQANRLTSNSQILSQSVDEKRQSVSSVSLDEEMANVIKFQHAYNAAARQITVVDEMLDKIINGMGTGGR
ncbi:flagellar hook-associated protein FlgK [Niallia oryzisoli]|uniref:Flagellar hook-associated protein 1 n=1 Tax=Niallia oryzisoli TaxID=1737571 RepID=A0ABZ2CBC0_9BACI